VYYKIGEHEIQLFKIRQVTKILGITNEGLRKKEKRGMIPPPIFYSKNGSRLYSPEEIAVLDYVFKTLWTKHQGVKTPEALLKATTEALNSVRLEVAHNGKVTSSDVFNEAHEIYPKFIPGIAMSHVLHWRAILLGEEEEEDEFDVQDYLNNI